MAVEQNYTNESTNWMYLHIKHPWIKLETLTNLPWLESLFIVAVPKNDSLIGKGLQRTNLDFYNFYYIIIIEDRCMSTIKMMSC